MKNTKKRALTTSAVAIVLCVVMLIGATFAWFTDSASTGGNTIKSGIIDIELVDSVTGENVEGETLGWLVNGEVVDAEEILWEPGATFISQPVRILNNSNLAFYLDTCISGVKGDLELLDAIEFKIVYADFVLPESMGGMGLTFDECDSRSELIKNTGDVFTTGTGKSGHKFTAEDYGVQATWTADGWAGMDIPAGEPKPLYDMCIIARMKETAGNQYQDLSLTGFAITVTATQAPAEYDSYTYLYDKDAEFPIVTKEALEEALVDDSVKNVVVGGGYYDETVTVPVGKSLTTEGGTFKPEDQYAAALDIEAGAEVTLNGGTYMGSGQQVINVQVKDANVTINNGHYEGSTLAWNCGNSQVTINGGTFDLWCIAVTDSGATYPIIINGGTFDLSNGTNGFDANSGCPIVINGGTFNQNPTNWLGEGHSVTANGDGTWTVK